MFDDVMGRQAVFFFKNAGFFLFLVFFSASLTFLCRRYVRIMDHANERSMHSEPVPRSGGIAIVGTFVVGTLTYYGFRGEYFVDYASFWGVFAAAIVVSIVSLYDDITNRSLSYKLVSQVAGAVILITFGLVINVWTVPLIGTVSFGPLRYTMTILWIVGMTNAFNFMDGIDGLAAGVAVVAAVVFSAFAYMTGSGVSFHVGYIIAAACIGFMLFNYPRATIFMGDVGSTFLGVTFGALAILSSHYEHHHTPFALMPILFANFILETFFTFVWRLVTGQHVFSPHKLHPYQLLVQMGFVPKKVAVIYFLQTFALAGLCVVYFISPTIGKAAVLLSIVIGYTLYFVRVHRMARARGLLKNIRRGVVASL